MANEINIQGAFTVQRANLNLQGSGNWSPSPAGAQAACNQVSVATSGWTQLKLIDGTVNAGYLFIKNTDATNYVHLSLDNAGSKIFAKLRANEFCLIPLPDGTPSTPSPFPATVANVWAQAAGAAVSVIVAAAQF